jgi:hypothetical protein
MMTAPTGGRLASPKVSRKWGMQTACHPFFGRSYGLHCRGVTASGVPLPELTQPAAVSLHG